MEAVIAFDYTAAASHWPGVGRYGRELVRALAGLGEEVPPLVLFERGKQGTLPATALGINVELASGRMRRVVVPGAERVLGWKARLLGRGIEGALRAAAPGPLALVHRAFPDRPPVHGLPQLAPLFELPAAPDARADLGATLARLDHVVVGSAAGRDDALAALPALDPAKVTAVRTGADHWLRDADPLDAPAGPPELVVLGALSQARAPLEILAAFECLHARRPEVRLHFDGRPGDATEAVEERLASSSAKDAVTWNREPREAALPARVSRAAALVHLSLGELSPVTPLEALHFGVPVVVSDVPAFRATLPPESIVADAVSADPERLAVAFEAALESSHDSAARAARRTLAAPFTWQACATDHLAIWRTYLPK